MANLTSKMNKRHKIDLKVMKQFIIFLLFSNAVCTNKMLMAGFPQVDQEFKVNFFYNDCRWRS